MAITFILCLIALLPMLGAFYCNDEGYDGGAILLSILAGAIVLYAGYNLGCECPPEKEETTCTCHHEQSANYKFCPTCGQPMEDSVLECPAKGCDFECEKDSGYAFCPECGTELK